MQDINSRTGPRQPPKHCYVRASSSKMAERKFRCWIF